MRLDELTGVKHLVKSIRKNNVSALATELIKRGYKVNVGSRAVVVHYDENQVIKLFNLHDICYTAFVDYCKHNKSNQHLPKFKTGAISMLDTQWGMIRIEPLQPLSLETEEEIVPIIAILWNLYMIHPGNDLLVYSKIRDYFTSRKIEHRNIVLDTHSLFFQTYLDLLKSLPRDCVDDTGGTNIMQRSDGTLVITDPWAI